MATLLLQVVALLPLHKAAEEAAAGGAAAQPGYSRQLSRAQIQANQKRLDSLSDTGAEFRRDVELNAGFQTIGGIVLDQARINGTCDLTQSRIYVFRGKPAIAPQVLENLLQSIG